MHFWAIISSHQLYEAANCCICCAEVVERARGIRVVLLQIHEAAQPQRPQKNIVLHELGAQY